MDEDRGYNCPHCGTRHKFGAWALAHITERLVHTCSCGAKNKLLNGRLQSSYLAERFKRPREESTAKLDAASAKRTRKAEKRKRAGSKP